MIAMLAMPYILTTFSYLRPFIFIQNNLYGGKHEKTLPG